MEIGEFLLARIAEDEQAAREAADLDVSERDPVGRGMWDEDRVLAECEAKRKIVRLHMEDPTDSTWDVLYFLALSYADHPDYRDEWRP